MKERIEKIIIAITIPAGIVCIGTLMNMFLPFWLNCVICGVIVAWLLYDVSKPEQESYWFYTFLRDKIYGSSIMKCKGEYFDFATYHKSYKDENIIMVQRISKEQYERLDDMINNKTEGE